MTARMIIHRRDDLEAVALMAKMMKERGIRHTTSEGTLRGFTCAQAKVDPKVASSGEIRPCVHWPPVIGSTA